MNLEINDLWDILEQTIIYDVRHDKYGQCCKLAEFAQKIVTGENQDDIITSYRPRESVAQKRQRVSVTNTMTRYVALQIINFYEKIRRADNKKIVIGHDSQTSLDDVLQVVNSFYASQSLEDYLLDRLLYFNFTDPNAFLFFNRHDEKNTSGKITENYTYPVEISSKRAINYRYKNGNLYWLLFYTERKEEYIKNSGLISNDLTDYHIYSAGYSINLWEYKEVKPPLKDKQEYITITKGGTVLNFVKEVHETGSKEVPAIKVGAYNSFQYPGVQATPLEPAKEVLMDLINLKSEFDLTKALHTFLQKVQYVPPCSYVEVKGGRKCMDGYLDGDIEHICPSCNGKGISIHASTQDVILVDWPEKRENHLPLSEVAKYIELPDWLPKWQADQLDILMRRVTLAVFGTEVFKAATTSVVRTATEIQVEYDKVYDRLAPYANHVSRVYMKAVRLIAQYKEKEEGLTVEHKFPYDFHLETEADLLHLLENAKASGASFSVISSIQKRLVEKMYANNPDEAQKVLAKQHFLPFASKTDEERMLILTTRASDDFDRVLYENFDTVFALILDANPDFHTLSVSRQRELVRQYTEQVMQQVKTQGFDEPIEILED